MRVSKRLREAIEAYREADAAYQAVMGAPYEDLYGFRAKLAWAHKVTVGNVLLDTALEAPKRKV